MSRLQDQIERWDGECVVVRHDRPTGTWIFVAVHDRTLGMAMGGCRMKVYPTPADGLRDAQRLAAGMGHHHLQECQELCLAPFGVDVAAEGIEPGLHEVLHGRCDGALAGEGEGLRGGLGFDEKLHKARVAEGRVRDEVWR